MCFYASPSSVEAYRVWQLTINFELWVEIFCVPTWFHMRIPKPCLSVRPYPENWNHPGFVNISLTLVNDTSMERSSRVLQYENRKIWFFFKKVRNWQNWILSVPRETKSSWLRQYHSYISNWYVNRKVFISTTKWEPNFFQISLRLNLTCFYTCAEEQKSTFK